MGCAFALEGEEEDMECCARVLMALSSQPSVSAASRGSTAAARTSAGAAAAPAPTRKRPAAVTAEGRPALSLPAAWAPALLPAVLLSIGGRPFGAPPCSAGSSSAGSGSGSGFAQLALQNAPPSMHSNVLHLPGDLREVERRMARIDESAANAALRWGHMLCSRCAPTCLCLVGPGARRVKGHPAA